MLLKWCQDLAEERDSLNESIDINSAAFSPIMVELIRSALKNQNKAPNARRFSEVIMNFSIYLYIMAGKACYEIISSNLPLPKANTISEYDYLASYLA